MKNYLLRIVPRPGGVPWSFNFSDRNDDSAREAARGLMRPDDLPVNCAEVRLYEMTPTETASMREVARYRLPEPKLTETVSPFRPKMRAVGGRDPRRDDCCEFHRNGGNLDFKCRV